MCEKAIPHYYRTFIAADFIWIVDVIHHYGFFQNILKGLQPNIKSHAKLPKGEKSAVIPMSESSAGLITKNNSFLSQTWLALAITSNLLGYTYIKSNIYSKINIYIYTYSGSSTIGHSLVICVKMDACQTNQFHIICSVKQSLYYYLLFILLFFDIIRE